MSRVAAAECLGHRHAAHIYLLRRHLLLTTYYLLLTTYLLTTYRHAAHISLFKRRGVPYVSNVDALELDAN